MAPIIPIDVVGQAGTRRAAERVEGVATLQRPENKRTLHARLQQKTSLRHLTCFSATASTGVPRG